MGYDHEDLVAGRIRWTDLTPPEWRDRDTQLIQKHKVSGTLPPFEKEYFRKDGSRVPVLIGVATFEEGGDQGVAFVLDLTERKRAEEALRESEYNLQKIIETVPSHLWSADPAGEPTQLSQRALDYYGIQLEDFKHGGWEHTSTRTTIQKLQGLSITQFRPEIRIRMWCVCAGRTASFVGTIFLVNLCAINKETSSSGMACLSTSMMPRRPKTSYAAAKRIWRKHRG